MNQIERLTDIDDSELLLDNGCVEYMILDRSVKASVRFYDSDDLNEYWDSWESVLIMSFVIDKWLFRYQEAFKHIYLYKMKYGSRTWPHSIGAQIICSLNHESALAPTGSQGIIDISDIQLGLEQI